MQELLPGILSMNEEMHERIQNAIPEMEYIIPRNREEIQDRMRGMYNKMWRTQERMKELWEGVGTLGMNERIQC